MWSRALAAAVIAACVSAAASSAAAPDAGSYVLRLSDLPSGYGPNDWGYLSRRRAASGIPPKTFRAFGWLSGFNVLYERSAMHTKSGSVAPGLAEAFSAAVVYATSAGAHAALAYADASVEAQMKKYPSRRLSVREPIGDEARFYLVKTNVGDLYIVSWRSGRVESLIKATGPSGTVKSAQVLSLARKQQRHIDQKGK